MNKHLRNLIGAVRCKTLLYANEAKRNGSMTILTDYTMHTVKMFIDLQSKQELSLSDRARIDKEIVRIYFIEAEVEDYIRGANYETEI